MVNKEEFRKFAIKSQGISGLGVDTYISTVENMTRAVIEERPTNFREIDVFSRLMADRIIFLGMPIDDYVANIIIAQLLFLESTDARKDILMYINSPGGAVYAGLGIYDTMQYVRPDVVTICTGMAASMGAVLLCAGTAGKRSALPHSRVMIHQPMGGAGGQASDIAIISKEIQKMKKEIYEVISLHTKQPYEKVWQDADRDHWLNAYEAKEYGLVDEVLVREKPSKK
ncbi:MAG: ATP-dependent Clp protease proteolytic subunit [Flammeovirgaceae bacterium]|nr:ATP-dependent Clp protease proteolytic subunit [Flammeovirgaceae bacterium]MDW8287129.1 ATP-dependent Clp protease proteolytic subunit [Flammeovirgaceae bacterium]